MRWQAALILGVFVLVLPAACSTSQNGDSGDDDRDDDAAPLPDYEDNQGDGDSASAPDRFHVFIHFVEPFPDAAAAEDLERYVIESDYGALVVLSASYDAGNQRVGLETEKQKLGVTYSVSIDVPDDEKKTIKLSFLAADTADFWATNFDTGEDYEITAKRLGVGEHCVVYVQEGQVAGNVDGLIATFDQDIFPIETALFAEPLDIDGNGRILLLGLDGQGWYGGYFNGVNAYSDDQTMGWWGLHSNEMEMLHINTVGGYMDENVTAHEFQHLLYNARHGFQDEYWSYHDEGLAETAVQAVYGNNDYAIEFFLADPEGMIGEGISLVHWTYALYENYVQAYLWWIYLSSRLGGLDNLTDIFELETGNPAEVDALIADRLSSDMPTLVFQNEIANWVQAGSGIYGFDGLLSFTAGAAPTVAAGVSSVDLEPFGGAFFPLDTASVSYPGTEGENVVYAGIGGDGEVDLTEPFAVQGGALFAYNMSEDTTLWTDEHSGPDIPASEGKALRGDAPPSPAWFDPPPLDPRHPERFEAWRDAARHRGPIPWTGAPR